MRLDEEGESEAHLHATHSHTFTGFFLQGWLHVDFRQDAKSYILQCLRYYSNGFIERALDGATQVAAHGYISFESKRVRKLSVARSALYVRWRTYN